MRAIERMVSQEKLIKMEMDLKEEFKEIFEPIPH